MIDVLFFAGLAAITAGVAFIFWPAALIVGGLCLSGGAFWLGDK